jgi:hypothetical protein
VARCDLGIIGDQELAADRSRHCFALGMPDICSSGSAAAGADEDVARIHRLDLALS